MGPKLKAWFDIQPACRPYAKNARFMELSADWWYWVQFPGKSPRRTWIAYRYFCNGASIPWAFRPIIGSPYDPVFWAFFFAHDEGYFTHRFSRPVVDEIGYQLLEQSNRELKAGLLEIKMKTIWAAVRVGGYPAWCNSTQDKKDLAEYRAMIAARPQINSRRKTVLSYDEKRDAKKSAVSKRRIVFSCDKNAI